MEEVFCQYITNLYNDYVDKRQTKYFYVHKSCYESDDVAIWEYGNVIHASSIIDYFFIVDDAEYKCTLDKTYGEIPQLLYETEDETEICNIINAFAERDYSMKLDCLYNTVQAGKHLFLIFDK